MSLPGSPPSILSSCTPVAPFSRQDLGGRPGQTRPPAEVYIKLLSLCVIKQLRFPLNGVPIVKARTYMIYSRLCLFRGASVENMMERMTALLLKSVWMIESGVVVKWAPENVSWFLSLKFWQYSFFLRFSRGSRFIVLRRPYPQELLHKQRDVDWATATSTHTSVSINSYCVNQYYCTQNEFECGIVGFITL